jgi:cytoskeletal protein RodZ
VPFEGVEDDSLVRAGEKLRIARESQKLGLPELALRTKINERHLAALENSDFAGLPARIYAVGFARSYAAALGLDSKQIAAQVRAEVNALEAPAVVRPAYDLDLDDPAKIPSRRLAWIVAALAIALLVAVAVYWRSYFAPAVELPPVSQAGMTPVAPEFSPAAVISPTAESAVAAVPPLAAAGSPVASPAAAPAARASARPAPPAAGVQTLPAPVPEQLRPAPAPAADAASEPGIEPPAD